MSVKLKPCPLCGSKARMEHWLVDEWTSTYAAQAKCRDCRESADTPIIGGRCEVRTLAAEAWNRRTEPQP